MKGLPVLGFVLCALTAWGEGGDPLAQAQVLPPAGSYAAPLTVEVKVPTGTAVRYRFLETPSTASFPWTGSLTLDALGGESRTATLRVTADLPTGESVTRDYRYTVFRAVAAQPTVQPVPGTYPATVTLLPTLPSGWTLEGPTILDTPAGTLKTFVIDVRGPESQQRSWTYTVDRRDQERSALTVLSPIPGAWANPQTLAVAFEGVDRVQWSYGPRFDPASARDYEGPVVLEKEGLLTVTVAGRSRAGAWVTKTVSWTNGAATVPGWPSSPTPLTGLDLSEVPGTQVSWDEGKSWQPSRSVHVDPSAAARKVLSVQARGPQGTFRVLYWLDARPSRSPEATFSGGWNPQVVFSGSVEGLHRVTWTTTDGRRIDDPTPLWGPRGSWKVPDGVVGARVGVRGANGTEAPAAILGFAATGWSTPEWEPWDQKGPLADRSRLPLGGRILPRPGFEAVYAVSDRPDVPEPDSQSAVLTGAFLPSVPWGADRTFYVRFAWRDAAGLVGPATPAVAVRVDRVPPGAPEVVQVPGQVIVRAPDGEEEGSELFWAVTTDRVGASEGLTFQPYRTALDAESLQAAGSGKLWFHAQARDRSGNPGPVRLNVALRGASEAPGADVVQVDADPAVGEFPVVDRGVYPWGQFRLRAAEPGQDLWVGVTDQSGVPTGWQTLVQPWSGLVSRGVARGERRTFLVYWNRKASDGWAWDKPRTLTLTLDQGPPAMPLVQGTWPGAPLASAWSLAIQPGQTGDTLRYSFTLDGSAPPDPLTSGQPWPGIQTWDAPADSRMVVRVRVVAVSVSGLSVTVPLTAPVVLDKTVPPAVVPSLDPFTWASGPLTVALPESAGRIRYSLTSDGSVPEAPSLASPTVGPRGLVLAGAAGQSVLYRFRWRTFSDAGLAGPSGDAYSVLVDRTQPTVQRPASPGPDGPVAVPRITGFPGSGVSASPVILRADSPGSTLRYELMEGLGEPRPVTGQSRLWDADLTLDGGPGVDRTFDLAVRRIGVDGSFLSPEIRYSVRVDRSGPLRAEYALVADSRRPEVVVKPSVGNPDETLTYRWFWESYPRGQGESTWKSVSEGPAVFAAPDGALTRLKVQAFLRDEAGNEGPVVEQSLLVDQNVVYLAPLATGDGTRDNPFGSLAEALTKSRREGRTVLLSAAGSFPVGRTADLGGLRVYGGLDSELWEASPSPGRSVFVASVPFTGSRLVESGDRPWSIDRVDLSTGEATLDAVVVVEGGAAAVRDSVWTWSAGQTGWDQHGGSLTLSGVSASWTARPGASVLRLNSTVWKAKALTLASVENQGGMLVALKGCTSLVQDLVLISKRSTGYDGVLSVVGGSLTVDGARILAGEGADRSAALVSKDAEVLFWNAEVALYGSKSNTGFQVSGGRLEAQKATVSLLRGDEFNQALVLDRGEAVLQTFGLKLESGAYQGGMTVDNGTLKLQSGTVQIAGGGLRAWGAQFLGICQVQVTDVKWKRAAKTAGSLWLLDKPWAEGSSVDRSTAQGW